VVCSSCIDDHAMKGASFRHNLLNSLSHAVLLGDVGLYGGELAAEAFRYLEELVAWGGEIYRVDFCGTVDETAFCYPEANSAVCTSDYGFLLEAIRVT
jgi:hypothetical protein